MFQTAALITLRFTCFDCKVRSNFTRRQAIPFMMNGTHSRLKYVRHGRFARMEFTSNHPLHVHSDGEIYAGMDSRIHDVTITAVRSAIRVALPAAEPAARDDA